MLAHPQGHAQDHAARGERVARHPIDELTEFGLQRRHVEFFVDILQAIVQARVGGRILGPDDAHAFARAQRDGHKITWRKFKTRRHPVGIGLVECYRHQDIDNSIHTAWSGRFLALKEG